MPNPGQTTLGTIRTQATQRADMENSQFVSTSEWNSYINASYQELYDLLVQKYGNNYAAAPFYTFVTDGTSDQYALPDGSATYKLPDGVTTASAFYKMLGVDLVIGGGTPQYSLTIKPFQIAERNRWAWPNMQALYGLVNLRYRIHGNNIWLIPKAGANQTIRLIYIPRLTALVNDADVVDGVSGWEEYIVVDAAIKAMQKEESDISALMAQKAALIARIEAAAENRDAGSPATVSDSRGADYEWPPGASGFGWGMN